MFRAAGAVIATDRQVETVFMVASVGFSAYSYRQYRNLATFMREEAWKTVLCNPAIYVNRMFSLFKSPKMSMSQQKSMPSANIDNDEVTRFAKQADTWWDPHGPFRPLHQIGPVRLKYIRDRAIRHFAVDTPGLRPLRGLTCLDVGCGGGLTSEPLARMGATVTAVDPAEESIAAAQAHAGLSGLNIDYRAVTAEQLLDAGRLYDLVVCLEVIEHVPEPSALVTALAGLVRPGGLLIMSTINRTPQSYVLAIFGAEYILRWVPVGTHRWDKFVRPAELRGFMRQAGFAQFASMGIVYSPINDTWSLSDDTGVNYMASAVRERGSS